MVSYFMHILVETINLFSQYLHRKRIELLTKSIEKAYEHQKMDLSPYSIEQLQDVLTVLYTKIIKSEEMRNPPVSLVATAVRMHLLTRGVFPHKEGTQSERVTLLRWWHLHHQNHPQYENILKCFQECIGIGDDYEYCLMTNQTLSREQWLEVFTYFSNQYETFIYREQGRFFSSDVTSIPTDLMAGKAVLFSQPQSIEQTLAFLYAKIDHYQHVAEDMDIDVYLDDNFTREIQAIQHHTAPHHDEVARLCDFWLSAASPWRAMWFLTGDTTCFKNQGPSYEEETILF